MINVYRGKYGNKLRRVKIMRGAHLVLHKQLVCVMISIVRNIFPTLHVFAQVSTCIQPTSSMQRQCDVCIQPYAIHGLNPSEIIMCTGFHKDIMKLTIISYCVSRNLGTC